MNLFSKVFTPQKCILEIVNGFLLSNISPCRRTCLEQGETFRDGEVTNLRPENQRHTYVSKMKWGHPCYDHHRIMQIRNLYIRT
jgi:hypothetical protein